MSEQMVPLWVPESMVREAVQRMRVTAEEYRDQVRDRANVHTTIARFDYLARAAAIEWAEANPERRVTRNTPLGTEVAHAQAASEAHVIVGWDGDDALFRDELGAYFADDPDGWYVVDEPEPKRLAPLPPPKCSNCLDVDPESCSVCQPLPGTRVGDRMTEHTPARDALENLIAATICAAWEAHDARIEETDGESVILTNAILANPSKVIAALVEAGWRPSDELEADGG